MENVCLLRGLQSFYDVCDHGTSFQFMGLSFTIQEIWHVYISSNLANFIVNTPQVNLQHGKA